MRTAKIAMPGSSTAAPGSYSVVALGGQREQLKLLMRVLAAVLVVVRLASTQFACLLEVKPTGGNALKEDHKQEKSRQKSQLQPDPAGFGFCNLSIPRIA